ncbi:tetratricopeptide repeat protein [[Clostridium] polysaccharolyticum]|uniref:Tetratricopeptide repeat-containing protein n=1 Tax=[Clostridium] polysaccharolyticum TaxID=29364 RepID=A0A1H9YU23_9FIRM|nr:tetratricopeptide repeat protein [[Clostridium] polysaccharolyticum]SES72679.1 Tetratricopeptide repeat-containing protein [[Clostridium] polysaccharolyticum]
MYRRNRRRYRRNRILDVLLVMFLFFLVLTSVFLVMNRGYLSYQKGKRAIRKELYQTAAECLQKATKREPSNKEYRIVYGLALAGNGEYEDALKEFDKGISKKNTSKAAKRNKKAYRGIGICYFFAKNYENSIINFDKALKIDALEYLNLDILKYKADAQLHLGHFENAVEVYTHIIKNEKYSDDSYLKRAYAKAEGNRVDDALEDYDYVIEKNSRNFDAYLGAYTLLAREEQEEKADSYLQAALKVKPVTLDEKLKYAIVQYYFYGITDEAVESLQKLVEEKQTEAYFYLAKIAFSEEEFEKVSTYLNSYVSTEHAEHLAEAYEMLGRCAMLVKDYERALNCFSDGISCNEVKWTRILKKNQIAVYEYLSDFDKAYDIATEYLTDFPDDQEIIREVEFIKTRLNRK